MYHIIEVFDSGYEREVTHFDTEKEAIDYCEQFGYRTSQYSYLTIVEC